MNSFLGSLPAHEYVWIDSAYTHKKPVGFVRGIWFGLTSYPGRMFGCNCLLETGGVYRGLPLHALASEESPELVWSEASSQRWDCYGWNFSAHEYQYLRGLRCKARCDKQDVMGDYLFTVAPVADAFSASPSQSKEFFCVRLDNGRYTMQPSNYVLFEDKSFTDHGWQWPEGLKTQEQIYSCE